MTALRHLVGCEPYISVKKTKKTAPYFFENNTSTIHGMEGYFSLLAASRGYEVTGFEAMEKNYLIQTNPNPNPNWRQWRRTTSSRLTLILTLIGGNGEELPHPESVPLR